MVYASVLVAANVLAMVFLTFSLGIGAEKVKFGTSTRFPVYYLLIPAAEEKEFWRENGLDVEWVPFLGSTPHYQAVAAGSIKAGMDASTGNLQAIGRGIPVKMVAHMQTREEYFLWTRADSPRKSPRDIKGGKIGIIRFGGPHHAYGRAVARALGFERDVKFVAAGSFSAQIAALKTGSVDAIIIGLGSLIMAQLKGEVRSLLSTRDYLPEPWLGNLLFAETKFLANSPEVVQRVVRALVAASNFVRQDRKWAIARIMKEQPLSEQAANILLDSFDFATDVRIEPKAVENVRSFLMDNEIVPREKMPPLNELYVRGFWK